MMSDEPVKLAMDLMSGLIDEMEELIADKK